MASLQLLKESDALESIIEAQEKTVLIFGAEWCSSCTALLENLSTVDIPSDIRLLKIDVDHFQDISDRFSVKTLPHSILIDKGTTVSSYTGSNAVDFRNRLFGNVEISQAESLGAREPEIPSIENDTRALYVSAQLSRHGKIDIELLEHLELNSMAISLGDLFNLNTIVDEVFGETLEDVQSSDVDHLYIYRVPTVSLDGTCSNVHQLAKEPFNLAEHAYKIPYDPITLAAHPMTKRLMKLKSLVAKLNSIVQADWVGIYRLIQADGVPSLMKESYIGEPSRAIFPVTEEFARKSTNSWVGLTGKVRIIANTRVREEGVSYYECSGQVQSELCVPILRRGAHPGSLEVIGIIDLESWNPNHFSPRLVLEVLKVAMDLGAIDLGLAN